jgi:hypothetical protein
VSAGIAFGQQQFAKRFSLLVASDSRCQITTAQYKCNRVANTITLNPPHLLKEDRADNSDVPKIQRESIRTRRERLQGKSGAMLSLNSSGDRLCGSCIRIAFKFGFSVADDQPEDS